MELEVGSQWVSGNTYAPTYETVVAIRSWADLSDAQKRAEIAIHSWHRTAESFANTSFVFYRARGARGLRISTLEVYIATRYTSVDEMFAAYAKKAAEL